VQSCHYRVFTITPIIKEYFVYKGNLLIDTNDCRHLSLLKTFLLKWISNITFTVCSLRLFFNGCNLFLQQLTPHMVSFLSKNITLVVHKRIWFLHEHEFLESESYCRNYESFLHIFVIHLMTIRMKGQLKKRFG
jgi:hypothetical protein